MGDPTDRTWVVVEGRSAAGLNPNQNRGPWCLLCGTEMNHPNHRFQGRLDEDGALALRRYRGVLFSGFEPLCGEGCLQRYVAQWAGIKQDFTPGGTGG